MNPHPALTFKPAFVGFGEAAAALVKGWNLGAGADIRAFDIKTDSADAAIRDGKWADYRTAEVVGCDAIEHAIADADVVFSTVTADQALIAAENAGRHLTTDTLFLDCNSCAPDTKRAAAKIIAAAGGRYVDVAIMAPVHPMLHKVPMLLSGEHAGAALDALQELDMNASIAEGDLGTASSIKMMRSIVIKGLEALAVEFALAARKSGVDETVMASLEKSFPEFGWTRRTGYMLERVMTHGARRAAEMREVAKTIEQLGLGSPMVGATVTWQQAIADLGLTAADGGTDDDNYQVLADQILQKLSGEDAEEGGSLRDGADYHDIPGTYVFDARQSRAGYHLNMFCMSLRHAGNRDAFKADEAAYLDRFPMTGEQRRAVLDRQWNEMLRLGGNIYYTSKLAATDGINFQDLAAIMTGVSSSEYRAMMLAGGRPIDGNRSKSEWSNG